MVFVLPTERPSIVYMSQTYRTTLHRVHINNTMTSHNPKHVGTCSSFIGTLLVRKYYKKKRKKEIQTKHQLSFQCKKATVLKQSEALSDVSAKL